MNPLTDYNAFTENYLNTLDEDRQDRNANFLEALAAISNPGAVPVFNHVGGDIITAPGAGIVNTGTITGDVEGNGGSDAHADVYIPGYINPLPPGTGSPPSGGSGGSGGTGTITNPDPVIEDPEDVEEGDDDEDGDTTLPETPVTDPEEEVEDAIRKYKYKGREYDAYNGSLEDYDPSARHGNQFTKGNVKELRAGGNYSNDQLSNLMQNLADEGQDIRYRAGNAVGYDFGGPVNNIKKYDAATVGNDRFGTSDVKHLLDQGYTKEAVIKKAQQEDSRGNLGTGKWGSQLVDADSQFWQKRGLQDAIQDNAVNGRNWGNKDVPQRAPSGVKNGRKGMYEYEGDRFSKSDARRMIDEGYTQKAIARTARKYGNESEKFSDPNSNFYAKHAEALSNNTRGWRQ